VHSGAWLAASKVDSNFFIEAILMLNS